ncbi:MAG: hypothetical protein NC324_02525 [Bacteroides sp.]|nr:hypothetical protein [Bacteroides sp.]
MSDVQNRLDNFLDEVHQAQIEMMMELGEKCLEEARMNRGYRMQTGALLSSTGYQVYVDGVAVSGKFDAAADAKGDAAAKGVLAGRELADAKGRETRGICLVVVAGMNYAAYVEAKGLNVLSSAEHLAERELPRMREQLLNDLNRAVKR